MLVLKRSMLVSQHYFLSTYQKENQSIAAYVAKLQRDLAEYNFTCKCTCEETVSDAENFLRAQFILGVANRERAFCQPVSQQPTQRRDMVAEL